MTAIKSLTRAEKSCKKKTTICCQCLKVSNIKHDLWQKKNSTSKRNCVCWVLVTKIVGTFLYVNLLGGMKHNLYIKQLKPNVRL